MIKALIDFVMKYDLYELNRSLGEDLTEIVADAIENDPDAVIEYLEGFDHPEAENLKSIIARAAA